MTAASFIAGNALTGWSPGKRINAGGAAGIAAIRGAVINCLVTGNFSAGVNGGACSGYQAWQIAGVTNCTIVANIAAQPASMNAGLCIGGATIDVVNTIVWGNLAGDKESNIGFDDFSDNYWGNLADGLERSSVTSSFATPEVMSFWPARGNLSAPDPGFADFADGDLVPATGSACHDAGLAAPWMETATDLAGRARIDRNRVDIGCFESPWYPPATILMLR